MIRICVSLPASFLKEVDRRATKHHVSRSTFIRLALMEKMKLNNMHDLKPPTGTTENDNWFMDFMDRLYGEDNPVK